MSPDQSTEPDAIVCVADMRESDIVPDLHLILDETTGDVDGITVSARIHPAFDPDTATPGQGALLVRFTDRTGRSRVAELEISAKWLEDSCWHTRTVTSEGVTECEDCGHVIDQTPTTRCPSCTAPVTDLVTLTGVHAASCNVLVMCQCEHVDHENPPAGHRYLAVPAGSRRAQYVGPVCDECATGHMATYLLTTEGTS